jgi:outer membrane biosynthesis protein TonB
MKHRLYLLIALGFFIIPVSAAAQVETIIPEEPVSRDTLVSFPGGDEAFARFVRSKLFTTKKAVAAEFTGNAEVQFVIDEKGLAGDIVVTRKAGYGCDEQAIRVIRIMPQWQPQVVGGRRIKSTLTRIIHFDATLPVAAEEPVTGPVPGSALARETAANAPLVFGQQEADLAKYITTHFKYPAAAPKNVKEVIVVKFKVGTDGRTGDIHIVSGISEEMDAEAVRVIKEMQGWNPKQVNFRPAEDMKELIIGFRNRKASLQPL